MVTQHISRIIIELPLPGKCCSILNFFPFAYRWSPLVWKACLVGEHFLVMPFLGTTSGIWCALLPYLNIILYKESDYFRRALTPWSKSNNSPFCSRVRKLIALGKCTVRLKFVTRWHTVFRTNAICYPMKRWGFQPFIYDGNINSYQAFTF